MEILFVLIILGVLLLYALGGALWLWLLLLVAASVVGFRAYRVNCKSCGMAVIAGRRMRFCSQCGVEQKAARGLRLWCESCRKLSRSELKMSYCNRCGAPVLRA